MPGKMDQQQQTVMQIIEKKGTTLFPHDFDADDQNQHQQQQQHLDFTSAFSTQCNSPIISNNDNTANTSSASTTNNATSACSPLTTASSSKQSSHSRKRKGEPVRGPESAFDVRFQGVTFSFAHNKHAEDYLHIIDSPRLLFSNSRAQTQQQQQEQLQHKQDDEHIVPITTANANANATHGHRTRFHSSKRLQQQRQQFQQQQEDLMLSQPNSSPNSEDEMVESESNSGLDATTVIAVPSPTSATAAATAAALASHRQTSHTNKSTFHTTVAAAAAAPLHAPVMVVDAFGVQKIKQCACCGCTSTPLWRDAGKSQPLCNACGIRWKKYNVICDSCNYVPCKQERDSRVCRRCGTGFPGGSKRRVVTSPNSASTSKRPLVFYTPKQSHSTQPHHPPQSAFSAPVAKQRPASYPQMQTTTPSSQIFTAPPIAMSSIAITNA